MFFVCFFKQKTAYELRISDWSSDVCSSDLDHSDTLQPRRNAMQTFFAEQFQKTLRALDDTGPNQGRIVVAAPRAGIAVALRRLSKALYKKVVLDLFQIGRASRRERVCQSV